MARLPSSSHTKGIHKSQDTIGASQSSHHKVEQIATSSTTTSISPLTKSQNLPRASPPPLLLTSKLEFDSLIQILIDQNHLLELLDTLWGSHRSHGIRPSLDSLNLIAIAVVDDGDHHIITSFLRWATMNADLTNIHGLMIILHRTFRATNSSTHASIVQEFIYRNRIQASPQLLIDIATIFSKRNRQFDAKCIVAELFRLCETGLAAPATYGVLIDFHSSARRFLEALRILQLTAKAGFCDNAVLSIHHLTRQLSKAEEIGILTVLLQEYQPEQLGGDSGVAAMYAAIIKFQLLSQPHNVTALVGAVEKLSVGMICQSPQLVAAIVAVSQHIDKIHPSVNISILSADLLRRLCIDMHFDTFNQIIDILSDTRLNRASLARVWYERMLGMDHHPKLRTILQIFKMYIHNRDLSNAERMFKEIHRWGYQADIETFGQIIGLCSDVNDSKKTNVYVSLMFEKGFDLPLSARPSLIRMFMRMHDTEEAVKLFKMIPNLHGSIKQIISEFSDTTRKRLSIGSIVSEMRNNRISKKLKLARSHSRARNSSRVEKIIHILTCLMQGFLDLKQFPEAQCYLELIVKLNRQESMDAFVIYIDALGRSKYRAELVAFVAKMPQLHTKPSESLFAALALAFSRCSTDSIHDVERIIHLMVSYYGIVPVNDDTWWTLLKCYSMRRNFSATRHLWLSQMRNLASSGRLTAITPIDNKYVNSLLVLLFSAWHSSLECSSRHAVKLHSEWIAAQFESHIINNNIILNNISWSKLAAACAFHKVPRLFLYILNCSAYQSLNRSRPSFSSRLVLDSSGVWGMCDAPQTPLPPMTNLKVKVAKLRISQIPSSISHNISAPILHTIHDSLVDCKDEAGIKMLRRYVSLLVKTNFSTTLHLLKGGKRQGTGK
ncbi:hypothetical protein BASA61_010442 [Batrachochytrium salamandrivorans]|nr:hypothetical protein BASA61_010442 [Batrachochytrium salamandrivorans]KAH9248370.1 hypothetical protein BASA81_013956 [Batrachochytrium salamandrivorans]KAJ1339172.1 hypothetical protein BSLG_006310 [Batrachochytrium salamandrivorans]